MRPAESPRASASASTALRSAQRLDGAAHCAAEVDRCGAQAQPVRRYAADVEHIVDEPREMLRLTAMARHPPRDVVARRLAGIQNGGSRADRCQRIAQLVTQNRQELVLRAQRSIGFGVRRAFALE
jgi:hypothetical protein